MTRWESRYIPEDVCVRSDRGLDRGTKTGYGGADGKNGSTRNGEYRAPTILAHTGGCAGSEGASVVVYFVHYVKNIKIMYSI